jgi:hypothetical protein
MTYDNIIRDCAARLENIMQKSPNAGSDICVWAIPTDATRNGYLHIGTTTPEDCPLAPIVRHPRGSAWHFIPYSDYYSLLWDACRSMPIMPIHNAA